MQKAIAISFVCVTCLFAGCSRTRYAVGVDSYVALPPASLPSSALIGMGSISGGNQLLNQEIQGKIGILLSEHGYTPVAGEDAEYIIVAVYGIGEPQTVSGGGVVVPLGNLLAYVPRSSTSYFRWLSMGVVDAQVARTYVESDGEVPWLWIGQVSSSGSSGDLRSVIDYLLVPLFETFGSSTGERVESTISGGDDRVERLREVWAAFVSGSR